MCHTNYLRLLRALTESISALHLLGAVVAFPMRSVCPLPSYTVHSLSQRTPSCLGRFFCRVSSQWPWGVRQDQSVSSHTGLSLGCAQPSHAVCDNLPKARHFSWRNYSLRWLLSFVFTSVCPHPFENGALPLISEPQTWPSVAAFLLGAHLTELEVSSFAIWCDIMGGFTCFNFYWLICGFSLCITAVGVRVMTWPLPVTDSVGEDGKENHTITLWLVHCVGGLVCWPRLFD